MINSLFNNAKEKINDVADAASDKPQTQVFDQIKEAGSDKIRDTWQ